MIVNEEQIRTDVVLGIAREVLLAIRTAPKTRGRDHLAIALADGGDMERIAAAMDRLASASGRTSFIRDAGNLRSSQGVLLVGVKNVPLGLDCGWCGFQNCGEKTKNPKAHCVFNPMDLGIGLGSAVAALARRGIDNRIMYSIGVAALDLGLFPPEVGIAIGIPVSVSGKSPYYDRK